jgi:hypothetical protein
VHAVVSVDESVDSLFDFLVSDVTLLGFFLSKGIEPLEGWVLETILWICFLGSSPGLWED